MVTYKHLPILSPRKSSSHTLTWVGGVRITDYLKSCHKAKFFVGLGCILGVLNNLKYQDCVALIRFRWIIRRRPWGFISQIQLICGSWVTTLDLLPYSQYLNGQRNS